MSALISPEAIGTLLMLIFLQAVLGFDNLLYISIESKRCPQEKQSFVRKLGIGLAIFLRLALLVLLVALIDRFRDPFTTVEFLPAFHADFSVHSLIVLGGGVFIIYTAIKEIMHMVAVPDVTQKEGAGPARSVAGAVTMIVVMNLVFSFDSILAAISLTQELEGEVFGVGVDILVMSIAILISGALMILLADTVAEFLKRNRLYEVLGLFILLIVGVMLVTEGGHLSHVALFGHPVHAMSKSTFYFVIIVLVLVDIVQGRYQSKLLKEQAAADAAQGASKPAAVSKSRVKGK